VPVDASLLAKARENPQDLRFDEAKMLATELGFQLARISGSHHIYTHPLGTSLRERFPRPLNLQEGANGKAKAYQVRSMLEMAEAVGVIPPASEDKSL
jgi:hypothetical protein